MDYYNISTDSYFSKLVDGLVLLVLGFSIGIVVSQVFLVDEVVSVTTKSTVITKNDLNANDSKGLDSNTEQPMVDVPNGAKIEQN